MCFSVEADLAVGVGLLPVGVLALREVRAAREVPFAALPLLFAAHHLVEALVWAGADGSGSAALTQAAAVAYVVFALPVLPTLLPLALLLLEPGGARWRAAPFLALGLVVSAQLSLTILANGVTVVVHPHALQYRIGLADAELWTALYVVAAVGAAVSSGRRTIVAFGLLNLVGLTVVAVVQREAFASLWCLYAALTSLLVYAHLVERRALTPARPGRRERRPTTRPAPPRG